MKRATIPKLGMIDQLRAAIAAEPGSLYALAEKAAVHRSALCRFASNERTLSAPSFAAVAEAMGFKLIRKR